VVSHCTRCPFTLKLGSVDLITGHVLAVAVVVGPVVVLLFANEALPRGIWLFLRVEEIS